MIPDWQLPPGTDRGVWDYVRNPILAANYDASLAGTPLLELDLNYCREHFATPGRLVDLGCGTGPLALDFAARGFRLHGRRPLGGDARRGGTEGARAEIAPRPTRSQLGPTRCVTGGLLRLRGLPLQHLRYDSRSRTPGRVPETRQRILVPGGSFIVHVHNRAYHRFRLVGWPWVARDLSRQVRGREPGEYPMPQHAGGSKVTLKHFTAGELKDDLTAAGFAVADFRPISLRPDGRFRLGWWREMRAYGFLAARGQTLIVGSEGTYGGLSR